MPGKLKAADDGLRPIGARALKSAIDTLRPYLPDAIVLDLFAGQGRLGYEALIEGAQSVTFVEKNSRTAAELPALRPKKIPAEKSARVIRGDALSYLETAQTTGDLYDIVFVDPPFPLWSEKFAERLFEKLATLCRPGTILLVKYPSRVLIFRPHSSFQPWKEVEFGESLLAFFTYGETKK